MFILEINTLNILPSSVGSNNNTTWRFYQERIANAIYK